VDHRTRPAGRVDGVLQFKLFYRLRMHAARTGSTTVLFSTRKLPADQREPRGNSRRDAHSTKSGLPPDPGSPRVVELLRYAYHKIPTLQSGQRSERDGNRDAHRCSVLAFRYRTYLAGWIGAGMRCLDPHEDAANPWLSGIPVRSHFEHPRVNPGTARLHEFFLSPRFAMP
jgi:hypothetical protein